MMLYTEKDKRIVGLLSICSGVMALACLIVGLVATQYDADAFANPVKLLNMTAVDTNKIRWFMLLDLFGYYLLLLPIVFFVHSKLEHKTPWAAFFTSLGFGYILVGAIGASVLSVIWPSAIDQHAVATESAKELYKSQFAFATDFVVKGMWNYLEVLFAGAWWLGLVFFVVMSRSLKIVTIILGTACIMDGLGEIMQIPVLAEVGLNIYLVLGIVWPIWAGRNIMKNKF